MMTHRSHGRGAFLPLSAALAAALLAAACGGGSEGAQAGAAPALVAKTEPVSAPAPGGTIPATGSAGTRDAATTEVATQLRGAVESANAAAGSFVVRGMTVSYDGHTRFDDGAASGIAAGVRLQVGGALAGPGTPVIARWIKFER